MPFHHPQRLQRCMNVRPVSVHKQFRQPVKLRPPESKSHDGQSCPTWALISRLQTVMLSAIRAIESVLRRILHVCRVWASIDDDGRSSTGDAAELVVYGYHLTDGTKERHYVDLRANMPLCLQHFTVCSSVQYRFLVLRHRRGKTGIPWHAEKFMFQSPWPQQRLTQAR